MDSNAENLAEKRTSIQNSVLRYGEYENNNCYAGTRGVFEQHMLTLIQDEKKEETVLMSAGIVI